MAAALAEAGVCLGDAVSERARDSGFRQAIDRVGAERLASAELMIVDWLIEQLKVPSEGKEKSILALWQALKGERRLPAGPAETAKPPARRPRHAISAERAAGAERSNARAAELERLLAVVKQRLESAEQEDPKP
jgi:hypothetical protein